MRKIRNILIIMVLFCILFQTIIPNRIHAATYTKEEVGKAIAEVAEKIVKEGNQKGVLRYSQRHRMSGYKWELVTDSKKATTSGEKEGKEITGCLAYDCSSFVSAVNNQVTSGVVKCINSGNAYTVGSFPGEYFESVPFNQRQPGDVLVNSKGEHCAIVLKDTSKTAEASGMLKGDTIRGDTEQVIIGKASNFSKAYRIKQEYIDKITALNTTVDWEGLGVGLGTNNGGFYYNGLAKRSNAVQKSPITILDNLVNISDYLIGYGLLGIKMQAIGWTAIFENIINSIVYFSSEEQSATNEKITVEKIIYNKVPVLDINFFDLSRTEGAEATTDGSYDIIYTIRDNIARVYYTFRNLAIICLLAVLVYIGIRIAISTMGAEKAKYKELFINWLVSFIIVFFIHFFMLGVILINEALIDRVARLTTEDEQKIWQLKLTDTTEIDPVTGKPKTDPDTGKTIQILTPVQVTITKESSLYESILTKAYDMKASEGIAGTILYMFLVYYLVKFLIIYFKRLLTIDILAVISPLIAISYAIDKIKDNKSQSLGTWMGEFASNVFIQLIHGLLYLIFVKTAYDLAFNYSLVGIIIAFVFLNFMLKAETLFFSMFKLGQKNSSLKTAADATTGVYLGAKAVLKGAQGVGQTGFKVASGIGKGARGIVDDFADSTNGNERANKDGFLKKTGIVYAHNNDEKKIDEMRKNREKLRAARGKVVKNTWHTTKGTLTAGGKLLSSIPKLIANPGLGLTGMIGSYQTLRKLYSRAEDIKLSEEKGRAYTAIGLMTGLATFGAIRGLNGMDEKLSKDVASVNKYSDKVREIAGIKAKELKPKADEKLLDIAKSTLKAKQMRGRKTGKLKGVHITYGQAVEASSMLLRGITPADLRAGNLGSLVAELKKQAQANGEVFDEHKFSESIYQEMTNTLVALMWQNKDEIEKKLDKLVEDKKDVYTLPTKERDEILDSASEKQAVDMMIETLQKLDDSIDKKEAKKAIEKYKADRKIKDDLKVKDAEKVLVSIAKQKGIERNNIKAKLEEEKQDTYINIAKKYVSKVANEDGYSVIEDQTRRAELKEKVEAVLSVKAMKGFQEAFAKLDLGGEVSSSQIERQIGQKEQDMGVEVLTQNMTLEELKQTWLEGLKRKGSIVNKK